MSAKGWPWNVLDLPRAPETTADVRRAYARKLKTIDQARDISGFEALRSAYEAALQRVEQKARKAAARAAGKAAAEPPEPLDQGAVDDASSPPATYPDRPSGLEIPLANPAQPAASPELPAIQSPEDRLRIRLGLLFEKSILLSPNAQMQAILDEPEFQAPELDQMLRHGLAQYIRSQLLWNHLNEPYLRHPGVTADLLKALDARFGWLSDYSAFNRDFWGDTHILEAMVDAAEIDRSVPPVIVFRETRPFFEGFIVPLSGFILLAFMAILRTVLEAGNDAPSDSAMSIFSEILIGVLVIALAAGGLFILYEVTVARFSKRAATLGCIWASIGMLAAGMANGVVPALPATSWPFTAWGSATFLGLAGFSAWWLFGHAKKAVLHLRNRRQTRK